MQDIDNPIDIPADFESVRQHPAVKPVLVIVAIIIGIITTVVLMMDAQPILNKLGGFNVFIIGLGLLGVTAFVFILTYVVSSSVWKKRNHGLEGRLALLEREKILGDTYQRYEDIQSTPIRLGWVPFYPTLVPDRGRVLGAGPGILKAIFEGKTEYTPAQSGWEDVFDSLNAGDFDVVATPMYDIKERRVHLEFSSPIFYSDIGLFAAVDNKDIRTVLSGRQKIEFKEAVELLSKLAPDLQFCANKGELQDKMVTKHFPLASINYTKSDRFPTDAALNAMVGRNKGYTSDLYFCERILGEGHQQYEDNKIYNILAPGQLLFPVAFAIRRGDDTLRKFINLRLMTIDGEQSSGIRDLLIEHTRGLVNETLMKKIDEYFLRKRGLLKQEGSEVAPNVLPFTG